jgi:hypothetical protein
VELAPQMEKDNTVIPKQFVAVTESKLQNLKQTAFILLQTTLIPLISSHLIPSRFIS